jgi:tripartite-type tricarboxylate transporter receptor subunit TctC
VFSLPASLMLRRLAALPAARLTTCLTTCLTTWLTSRLTAFLAVCLSACFALPAFAAYPEKPLRMVLPYAAGGSGDIIFRSIQPGMEKRLGQSIVIDFRTGAGGLIGVREVVRSAGDGYTLLFGPTNNFVIDQYLYRKLDYDPLVDLVPVTVVAETPYLLVISEATPASNYGEFAAWARANRGKLNYASPGPGTVPHLSGYILNETLGANMTHVAFRGNQPAVVAMLANEVHMIVHSYGSIGPLLRSGKLRALAVGAAERLRVLPNVPTTAEAGIPAGAISSNWWGMGAPRGTSGEIVNRLAREIRASLADPELQKRFVEQGWLAGGATPAEVAERLRQEAVIWKAIVERTGAKAD